MFIGIDASRATKQQKTGTEYYSQEILKNLAKIDYQNQYILYSPVKPSGALTKLGKNFTWKVMPFPKLWSQIRLSWEFIFGQKPDVIFEPAHTIPVIHPKNMVVTLHDLGFKYYPELYTPLERKYHNFCMDFSARVAKHIIAPSEYTKKDLIKIYGINPKKITIIHHGFDTELYNTKPSITSEKMKKNSPYIFFVGRIEKKKNIVNMLASYELLRKEKKIKHKLVLAGKPGYGYEEFQEKLNTLDPEIKKDVIELGYTSEEELANWLKNADIFFFPSNFEGFGMPVIESMACGTPVVCSNTTSLPEIAGSAAILVNPEKPLDMAAGLSKIINTPALKRALISKGLVRSRMFSWQVAAENTLKVLENSK